MALTSEQIKGRIKNLARHNDADARILLRIYMMERFLEKLSNSKYVDDFVIKGGILVTSMIGIAHRSTMDIDATIRNFNLSDEETLNIVNDIASIDLGDGITFVVENLQHIMDQMEYPGIRINMIAMMEKMETPIKIDISTGDVITPRAIKYNYQLMLENRSINLWSYNTETILAEKLQTILSRGLLNTRMRDFYDIHMLLSCRKETLDVEHFKNAFSATCAKRESLGLLNDKDVILDSITGDNNLADLWKNYQKKYNYASDISFDEVIKSVRELTDMCV